MGANQHDDSASVTGAVYVFGRNGCHDIAWFDAVGDAMHLWRCMPGARDFDCGGSTPTPPDAAPIGMHWGF